MTQRLDIILDQLTLVIEGTCFIVHNKCIYSFNDVVL